MLLKHNIILQNSFMLFINKRRKKMKNIIETERLLMRPVEMTDAQDIFDYAKDKDTGPSAGWLPHANIEETKEHLQRWTKEDHSEKVFAIVWKENQKVIGTIGIEKGAKGELSAPFLEKYNGDFVEIGNVISKEYWGKGISTEALLGICDYVFQNNIAGNVLTSHYEANIGSSRVQDKLAMKVIAGYKAKKPYFKTDNYNYVLRMKTRADWEKGLEK